MNKGIIYQGNSTISIETLPEFSQPVVVKKPAQHHASRRHILSLEKEYEMTRALDAVEGVRRVLERQSIENQPALILEYIEGETLRDHIARKTLDLRSKLEIAIELARILGRIHQQNVIHLDLNSRGARDADELRLRPGQEDPDVRGQQGSADHAHPRNGPLRPGLPQPSPRGGCGSHWVRP